MNSKTRRSVVAVFLICLWLPTNAAVFSLHMESALPSANPIWTEEALMPRGAFSGHTVLAKKIASIHALAPSDWIEELAGLVRRTSGLNDQLRLMRRYFNLSLEDVAGAIGLPGQGDRIAAWEISLQAGGHYPNLGEAAALHRFYQEFIPPSHRADFPFDHLATYLPWILTDAPDAHAAFLNTQHFLKLTAHRMVPNDKLPHGENAENVIQDLWLAVLKHWTLAAAGVPSASPFKGGDASLVTYLNHVIQNKILMALRSKLYLPPHVRVDDPERLDRLPVSHSAFYADRVARPDIALQREERRQMINQMLKRTISELPPQWGEALAADLQVRELELPEREHYTEVARRLKGKGDPAFSLNFNAMKTRVNRAKKKFFAAWTLENLLPPSPVPSPLRARAAAASS